MRFLASEIYDITGVKRNRLQQWIEYRFISPSIHSAEGRGDRNIWDRNDLYTIAVFKKLTESGLARKVIAKFLSKKILRSYSEINRINYILYIRKGQRVEAAAIMGSRDIPNIDFKTLIDEYEMTEFDDIYLINFRKIKKMIDERIKTFH